MLGFMLYPHDSKLDFPMGRYVGRTTVSTGKPRTAERNGRDDGYVWHCENYDTDGSSMCQSALQVMIHARRFTEGTDCRWRGPLLITATRSFIDREEGREHDEVEEDKDDESGSDATDEEDDDENDETSDETSDENGSADAEDDVEILPIDINLAHFRAFIYHTLRPSQA